MEFQVDPTTRVPIYRQLMDQIRLAVARGRLKPGSRLPSVRVLSRELVVNPNTMRGCTPSWSARACSIRGPGLGVFVAEPQADLSAAARRQRLAEIIDGFLTDAVHLGFSAEKCSRLWLSGFGDFSLWTVLAAES